MPVCTDRHVFLFYNIFGNCLPKIPAETVRESFAVLGKIKAVNRMLSPAHAAVVVGNVHVVDAQFLSIVKVTFHAGIPFPYGVDM